MKVRDQSEMSLGDWTEGTALAVQKRGPVTREDLARYAQASGDNNRIHLDDEFAKQAGFPSVIAHGMLSMAYLADLVRFNFPEGTYDVRRLSSRFRRVIFPGDELDLGGTVKKVESNQVLTVHLWVKNQKGEITTEGEVELSPVKH